MAPRSPVIDLEYLWSNSVRVGECWEWTGFVSPQGYPMRGRSIMHRESYKLMKGEIPRGYHVHHKCKNRKCINPEHLQKLQGATHQRQHADKYYKEFQAVTRPMRTKRKPQYLVIATASLPTY